MRCRRQKPAALFPRKRSAQPDFDESCIRVGKGADAYLMIIQISATMDTHIEKLMMMARSKGEGDKDRRP